MRRFLTTRAGGDSTKGDQSHVVLTGDLSTTSLTLLLREVFHAGTQATAAALGYGVMSSPRVMSVWYAAFADHGTAEPNLQAVILAPNHPSPHILTLLNESPLASRLTYIQGSPFNQRDLQRVGMERASACFLLANKFAAEPEEQDAETILTAMAVKRCATCSSCHYRVCMWPADAVASSPATSDMLWAASCAFASSCCVLKTPTIFATWQLSLTSPWKNAIKLCVLNA